MKRKQPSVKSPAKPAKVPPKGLKAAVAVAPKAVTRGKCVICGGAVAPFSSEDLCWVCRRLKISAWRDSESQPSLQE